jgi:threonine aldolase
MRYLAAQWDAYLNNELWLKNANHANAMAQKLKSGLESIQGSELYHQVEANEIFITLPEVSLKAIEEAGYAFYRWQDPNSPLIRLVTSFDTREEDVDGFIKAAKSA